MFDALIFEISRILCLMLLLLLLTCLQFLLVYIKKKLEVGKLDSVSKTIEQLNILVGEAVLAYQQKFVAEIKEKQVKLSEDQIEYVRGRVTEDVLSMMPKKGINVLEKNGININTIIDNFIEGKVYKIKNGK